MLRGWREFASKGRDVFHSSYIGHTSPKPSAIFDLCSQRGSQSVPLTSPLSGHGLCLHLHIPRRSKARLPLVARAYNRSSGTPYVRDPVPPTPRYTHSRSCSTSYACGPVPPALLVTCTTAPPVPPMLEVPFLPDSCKMHT
jgi:hypothetical protein